MTIAPLIITIERDPDGRGFVAYDNRIHLIGRGQTEKAAHAAWRVQAEDRPIFDATQMTPLLRLDRLVLQWPVVSQIVTQEFLARPDFYGKFGLPGHDGRDFRCPTGGEVRSCAFGTVTEIGWRRKGHPYGYTVRTRHKRERLYELIYAHGVDDSARVAIGDDVAPGQLLMLGDNTGNSSASHLHLSVKLPLVGGKSQTPPDGVRFIRLNNGEFLLDPEPFFETPPAQMGIDAP